MGLEGPAAETPGEASEAPSPPSVNPVAALASGCGMRGSRLCLQVFKSCPHPKSRRISRPEIRPDCGRTFKLCSEASLHTPDPLGSARTCPLCPRVCKMPSSWPSISGSSRLEGIALSVERPQGLLRSSCFWYSR